MKKLLLLLFVIVIIGFTNTLRAQATGDYRSANTGVWKAASTWQRYNGTAWVSATTAPSYTDGKISIRVGHTVISDTITKVDQVVIDSGGTLHLIVAIGSSNLILHNGTGFDLICNGNLIIDGNTVIDRDTGYVTVEYKNAALTNNGGIGPEITFDGAVAQKILGSGYNGALVVSNSKNLEITGTQSYNSVKFVSGKINVTGTGIFLIDQYNNGFSGQSAARFINGAVACVIFDTSHLAFSMPVGKGTKYLPFTFKVRQDSAVQTGFLITIIDSAPVARTLPATLNKVSSVRHYNIVKGASAANITSASLQLSYVADDDVSDPSNLRLANSNGSQWTDLGGVGTAAPAGTITSTSNFTTFGDFVLANATGGGNTLPLHIIAFDAVAKGTSALITWNVGSQNDVNHYELERTHEGNEWKVLTSLNIQNQTAYSFTDKLLRPSVIYQYRLKEVYKDNSWRYSNIKVVKMAGDKAMSVETLYPNPVTSVLHYTVACDNDDALAISLTDMHGSLLTKQTATCNQEEKVDVRKLSRGNYLLTIFNKTTGYKIVKEIVKE